MSLDKKFLEAQMLYEKKISDLEVKLAEKDLRIEELESQFDYECECNKQFVECQNENKKLKQQLAEKDEEITELKDKIEILEYTIEEYEQDTPDLIIAKLYKVKEKLRQNITITAPVDELKKLKDYLIGVDDYIDNQIKQLKEMK